MSTLQIETKNALSAFKNADTNGKTLLKNLFGKDVFSQKIIDRIKTWEDAAQEKGIDPVDSLPFKNPDNSFQDATNAFFMLDVIADVLNEGAVLDWTNSNQKKWYCWFNDYQSGSGFSFDDACYVWSFTATVGGARLCVDTQEKATYFGTQFLPLFNKFLNPIK